MSRKEGLLIPCNHFRRSFPRRCDVTDLHLKTPLPGRWIANKRYHYSIWQKCYCSAVVYRKRGSSMVLWLYLEMAHYSGQYKKSFRIDILCSRAYPQTSSVNALWDAANRFTQITNNRLFSLRLLLLQNTDVHLASRNRYIFVSL